METKRGLEGKGISLSSLDSNGEVTLHNAIDRHIPPEYTPNRIAILEIHHEEGDYVTGCNDQPHPVVPKIAPEIDENRFGIEKSEVIEEQVAVRIHINIAEFDPGWSKWNIRWIALIAGPCNIQGGDVVTGICRIDTTAEKIGNINGVIVPTRYHAKDDDQGWYESQPS
jgi:hypothetical protein